MPVPYLAHAAGVIPIDVGRQLFVDDFLIERDLADADVHRAAYVRATRCSGRRQAVGERTADAQEPPHPTAMVFSDGVWYDPATRLFKMWYMGGYSGTPCYATSEDGIALDEAGARRRAGHQHRPRRARATRATVWLDHEERGPEAPVQDVPLQRRRGQADRRSSTSRRTASTGASRWPDRPTRRPHDVLLQPVPQGVGLQHPRDDWRTVRGARAALLGDAGPRARGAQWEPDEPPLWVGADRRCDPRAPDLNDAAAALQPRLRRLREPDARAVHASGAASAAGPAEAERRLRRLQPRRVPLAPRPTARRSSPCPSRQGDWNWANVQSAGGCCLVVGDELYFYVSGRAGVPGRRNGRRLQHRPGDAAPRRVRLDGRRREERHAHDAPGAVSRASTCS